MKPKKEGEEKCLHFELKRNVRKKKGEKECNRKERKEKERRKGM